MTKKSRDRRKVYRANRRYYSDVCIKINQEIPIDKKQEVLNEFIVYKNSNSDAKSLLQKLKGNENSIK